MSSVDSRVSLSFVAGFLVLIVAVGLLARLVARASSPRAPQGPATPELIDTPPAIVNLLMNGLRTAPEAAAATLLHLAARRRLELIQAGETTILVRDDNQAGLTSYELRVLDRVQVPAGVLPLTLADLARRQAEDGQAWQERLLIAVREDAIARGLIRTGRSSPAFGVLVVGFMLALVASCVAGSALIDLAGLTDRLGDNGYAAVLFSLGFVLTMGAIVVGVLLAGDIRNERLTAEGRRVARHWTGVRSWLRGHEEFADLPPAAVTVWDSYLAYGVAVGAAPRAAATVDLRVGPVDIVRSPVGDRLVRVRYPAAGGLRGTRAGFRVCCAVPGVALAAAVAVVGPPAVAVAAGVLGLRWVYRLVRGLADLLHPATVSGTVLRIVPFGSFGDPESTAVLSRLYESRMLSWLIRRTGSPVVTSDGTGLVPGFFVVLDDGSVSPDGSEPVVTAWRATPRHARDLRPGDVITARVQPWTKSLVSAGSPAV